MSNKVYKNINLLRKREMLRFFHLDKSQCSAVKKKKEKKTDNDIVSTPDAYITRARALHGNSVNENVHNY